MKEVENVDEAIIVDVEDFKACTYMTVLIVFMEYHHCLNELLHSDFGLVVTT